jgi:hypothetical protein
MKYHCDSLQVNFMMMFPRNSTFQEEKLTGKIKIYSTTQHTLAICGGSHVLVNHSHMVKLLGSAGNNGVRRTSDTGKV